MFDVYNVDPDYAEYTYNVIEQHLVEDHYDYYFFGKYNELEDAHVACMEAENGVMVQPSEIVVLSFKEEK